MFMKVARIIKTAAWVYFIIGIVVTVILGITQTQIMAATGSNTYFLTVMLYYLIGLGATVVGFALIYGFANIVDYCERN